MPNSGEVRKLFARKLNCTVSPESQSEEFIASSKGVSGGGDVDIEP